MYDKFSASHKIKFKINLKEKRPMINHRDFSEEYDVELVGIDIRKNDFYPDESLDTPMYNMDFCWKFDYLAH